MYRRVGCRRCRCFVVVLVVCVCVSFVIVALDGCLSSSPSTVNFRVLNDSGDQIFLTQQQTQRLCLRPRPCLSNDRYCCSLFTTFLLTDFFYQCTCSIVHSFVPLFVHSFRHSCFLPNPQATLPSPFFPWIYGPSFPLHCPNRLCLSISLCIPVRPKFVSHPSDLLFLLLLLNFILKQTLRPPQR